jgi:hypothetical protein
MRIPGHEINNPGHIRLIDKFYALNCLILAVIILGLSFGSKAWGQGNLVSGSLSTPVLFDMSSYSIQPSTARTPVADVPNGLSATAAWNQYGMRLNWSVVDNGNGTYTYRYYFGPGWYPPTQPAGGTGGSTVDPYVTNKNILVWDIQLGAGITSLSQLSGLTWNAYQFDGAKIGSGTATHWDSYVDPDTGDVIDTIMASGDATVLKIADLTGKTGHRSAGYLTQNLFHGLQWSIPRDDSFIPIWNTDVNFDLTFASTYAPGWGNFFANSDQTKANNDYSEVVAFDGTFDATGKSIDTLSNGVTAAGGLETTPPTAVITDGPSPSVTKGGPATYTVTYDDDNFYSIALSTGNITLNRTGTANGAVTVSGTDTNGRTETGSNSRTVTISNITGDGTLGISLAAGTATDKAGNAALAAGPSETFTVDNTPPSVTISMPSMALTKSGPVTYTVTYGDANFNLSTLSKSDITLNGTGTATGSVSVSGLGSTRTVTINSITGNGTLGISIAAGTASDTAGNAAQASNPSLTFNVDNTTSTVSVDPSNGAQNIAVNSSVTAIFSEDIDPTTITGANFTLSGVNGTVNYSQATHTATFTPNTPLAYNTTYNATLTGIKDAAGNTMPDKSWTFNTEPIPAHPVASIMYSPSGPYKSGTIVTISAAFSEPMAATPVPKIALSGSASLLPTDMTMIDSQHYTYSYTAGSGDGDVIVSLSAGTNLAGVSVASTPISGATFAIDNTAPAVTSTSPPNGSSGMAINTPITATFSEAIDPSSLGISTFTVSGVTGTISYDPAGSTVTFIPNTPLAYSTSYTATVTGVKDPAGNTMTSDQSWTFNTGPMPDTTSPSAVIGYSPAGPYKEGTTVTITATFSEALADSPLPMISLSGADTLAAVNMMKTDAIHYTYNHTVGAATGDVTVSLSAGKDLAGNPILAAPVSGATFNIDNLPPLITDVYPANAAGDAAIGSTVAATFSEAVDPATINFSVSGVTGTVSYNETTYTATFTPDKALSYGTTYTATITGAKDPAGNIMAADKTWTFTTTAVPDTTPPAIISITPTDGEKGVDVKSVLTVQFSETVNLGNSSVTVNGVTGSTEYVDSTHTAYFIPSAGLAYYTTYTVTVTGVKDLAGNAMAADKTWTFTTAPHYGDLTGKGGELKIEDATLALQIAAGFVSPTALTDQQRAAADLAPLVNGKPQPDGKIDISDVVVILMKLVGLLNW